MLTLIALTLAQVSHDPEIEAILRHRDEKRRQEAQVEYIRRQEEQQLAVQMPPEVAERLTACLAKANDKPELALAEAQIWAGAGGGAYAAQCKGYALGIATRWPEAASAFETGASVPGIAPVTQGRLWAQAGNAALVAGDATRAAGSLDRALELPLPRTLSTGEIYLDRARARVALNRLPEARKDINEALVLAAADPLAWLLSATLARRMDDLPLATAHIEQAAKLANSDAAVALEQGVIYALAGGERDPAAKAAFERAQSFAAAGSETEYKARAYLAQLGGKPVPAREKKITR